MGEGEERGGEETSGGQGERRGEKRRCQVDRGRERRGEEIQILLWKHVSHV